MNHYTATINNMQQLVDYYTYFVLAHSKLKTRVAKDTNIERIDAFIGFAAANGMSKDELDELAGVQW